MEQKSIPYIVHEGAMARQERTIKRLFIIILVIFLAFVASNLFWIIRETQFEDVVISQEVEQDVSNGNNQFVGGDYYGAATNQADD